MINYRCNVKPKTNKYAHGGHVHNLIEKAYQGHSFGGDISDSSKAIVKKINTNLSSLRNNHMTKIPEYVHSGIQHIAQTAHKLQHGAKLTHELLKRYSGNN